MPMHTPTHPHTHPHPPQAHRHRLTLLMEALGQPLDPALPTGYSPLVINDTTQPTQHHHTTMQDTITRLLTEALATALKDALVPIVREAVTEALASQPSTEDKPVLIPDDIVARFATVEERLDSLESDMSDKADSNDIEQAVIDAIDNGSFSIEFRG